MQHVLSLLLAAAAALPISPSAYSQLKWRCIGPYRGGRTVAVSGVPGHRGLFYMAANDGGVWKTDDFGRTWDPIFDGQPTGSVGALAVAPSDPNVIYVGSGEGLRRPDLSTGDGIYKSTDAGASWRHLGLRDGQQIGWILVDPGNARRVFVAVVGHPYGPNTERGVFRSTDGGTTFDRVLYRDENTGAIDLAFEPGNPHTIYAAMWAARRPPWTTGNALSAPGSGLYKSVDGGSTWNRLEGGLPTEAQGLGRIGLGIASSRASRIYALADAPDLGGLYRSDDAGQTWKRMNSEPRIWGRGSDFAGVRADPGNPDVVYVANTSTYRSTDAGATFEAIKGAPGGDDYHTIWIDPADPRTILLGSDQGATISVNGGRTWSSWYNQPTAQLFHVATDNRFPYWVYGGQQESGSAGVASRGDSGAVTFWDWHPVGVEEYGYVVPDPLDPEVVYGGKATRFDRRTGQTQDVSPVPIRTGQYRYNRTAPLVFSPTDGKTLYLGSNVLFRTRDGGIHWDIVSPDLTRPDPGIPPNLGVFADSDPAKGKHRGVIYALAPSPKQDGLIWAGTDDGLIHVTRDGGKTWSNVTPPELTPWSKVSILEASHFDAQTAYAAVNRFRLDDLHPHIYRTRDGGRTWRPIVQGLADNAAVNAVREDPVRQGLLFAGTERAVWVSFDDGDHWQSLQENLPATSMRDLVIHGDDLVVGTHGRSFWILDDITPLRELAGGIAPGVHLFSPASAIRVRRSLNTDTPLPPEEPAGKNPPDGAIMDYRLGEKAGPVTLEIRDPGGNLVRRFGSRDPVPDPEKGLAVPTYWVRPPQTLPETPGTHRFVWDLRYLSPDALEPEYPISAIVHDTPRSPLGPSVLPGEYRVILTAGRKSQERPLTVTMDPRVRATPQDLARQLALETRLSAAMTSSFARTGEIRKLRHTNPDKKLEAFESGDRSFETLHRRFGTLLDAVDAADAGPTAAQETAAADTEKALADAEREWRELPR
jgi:photosystem II stability/assembly factor-like uncharacterized protein